MQTILGSSGVIGQNLAKALTKHTGDIRLVSRNPQKVNATDHLLSADLNDADAVMKAVDGSDVTYLTVGLEYKIDVWRDQWPRIMSNVINACKEHGSKLVFFDNVYAYGKVDGWMTENTPHKPDSRKGEVRARIADEIMNAVGKGEINALIARSADFYGPHTPLSFVTVMVFDRLSKGQSAQWMGSPELPHSMTYTPDAGAGTAILGNAEDAYNQVWHLPTAREQITGSQFIELAAREFGVKPKIQVAPRWMLSIMALFNSIIKENMEMLYQVEHPYLFDSTKFNTKFDFEPTSYKVGIAHTVRSYK